MKINIYSKDYSACVTDLIIIPAFEQEKTNQFLNLLGKGLAEEYQWLLKNKQFKGKFGETKSLSNTNDIAARYVVLLGLGEKNKFDLEKLRRAAAAAHRNAKCKGAKTYLSLLSALSGFSNKEKMFVLSEAALLTDYSFDMYKTNDKENGKKKVEELLLWSREKNLQPLLSKVKKAEIVSNNVNYCRDLVNMPPNILGPAYLASEARKLNSSTLKVTVLGKKELEKGKFGGILAVGSGSAKEPKLIVMEYNPKGAKNKKPIALVGKGITFDAGGLNIKPTGYINNMKSDMAGAAAVISTLKAAQELGIKQRIVGVVPSCENFLGSKAYRPDDILTMYSGKTVEVCNTDAEGRIILADALAYAEKKFGPSQMIDIATLTGACMVALGYVATGLLTNDDKMAKDLEKAGDYCGDRVWRLPLWSDYDDMVESDIADLRNVAPVRVAGTIEGAKFLGSFVEKTPWVHLDIAGTSFLKEPKHYNPKYATGAGVRLLLTYLG
ncbi:MAG: leucyl aminopeptidase [archaeon]